MARKPKDYQPIVSTQLSLKEDMATPETISLIAESYSVKKLATPIAVKNPLPTDWRIAGYIANTYILLETNAGLAIVEQHIAHERTLYEQLLARANKELAETAVNEDYRQNLIISLPLNLTEQQKAVLLDHISELAIHGFEFDFHEDKITCLQVPIELAHKDYARIIQALLEDLAQSSNSNPKLEIIKSLACQSAIKNGMTLAGEQILDLLAMWYNTPRNETCPHGRPIMLEFSNDKLFQLFHPA